MLVDSLQCTDNEYMHESCRWWVFIKLHAIKISALEGCKDDHETGVLE